MQESGIFVKIPNAGVEDHVNPLNSTQGVFGNASEESNSKKLDEKGVGNLASESLAQSSNIPNIWKKKACSGEIINEKFSSISDDGIAVKHHSDAESENIKNLELAVVLKILGYHGL